MSYQIDRLRSQIADLAQQNQNLADQVAAERRSRIETQAELTLAAQNVTAPRQLARLLQAEGALVEQGGELRLRTAEGEAPFDQGLPQLLATEEYSHYRLDQAPTANSSSEASGQFFQGGDRMPTQEELTAALADPVQSARLFAEVDKLIPSVLAVTAAGAPPTVQQSAEQSKEQFFASGDAVFSDEEFQAAVNDPTQFNRLLARADALMTGGG